MADNPFPNFEKKLEKSNDDYRTKVESQTIDEVSIHSREKKSNNEIIREEFLEKRSLFKRIINWQNIRKNSIDTVRMR